MKGTIGGITMNGKMIKNSMISTCSKNIYIFKNNYQSNHNKLAYHSVSDNGFNNWLNNKCYAFESFNWRNKDEWNNINQMQWVQILV